MTWHIDGDAIYEPGSEPGDIVCVRPGPEHPESDARWEERAAIIVGMRAALEQVAHGADYGHCVALAETDARNFAALATVARAALSRATAQNVGEG